MGMRMECWVWKGDMEGFCGGEKFEREEGGKVNGRGTSSLR